MAGDLLNDRMQNRILNRLWVRGEASRFVLCQEVGLSPSVMTKMTSDLIALGLIEEADAQRGPGRGRPSVPLRISPTAGYAIGAAPHYGAVDVTIVDFRGKPIAIVRRSTIRIRRFLRDRSAASRWNWSTGTICSVGG